MVVSEVPNAGAAPPSWRGFLLILLALIVEGFDLQAANFAAPAVVDAFKLSQTEIGPFLSASLGGVLLGAVLLGPLGDKYGRRLILVASCLAYGLFSLCAAITTSFPVLIFWRFAIGIGLGAVLPNALALAGELAPPRYLAMATGLVGIGMTFGGVLAGVAAAWIIPIHGWASLFVIGGALPIAIAILLWFGLPESPALQRDLSDARKAFGVKAILAPAFRWQTFAIWAIFALVLMVVYLLGGWIPLLIRQQGYSAAMGAWIGTAYLGGGVLGGVIASLLLAKRNWIIVSLFASASALCLVLLAAKSWELPVLAALILLTGGLVTGTQNGLNGSCGATYPASIRAAGLGWALGMGRVGSILGPLFGSIAIATGLESTRHFFLLPVGPLAIAGLLALWLARQKSALGPEVQSCRTGLSLE